jgi:hypothetical protein
MLVFAVVAYRQGEPEMFNITSHSYKLFVKDVDAWMNVASSLREASRAA